jgi:flagellar capping protein FliD
MAIASIGLRQSGSYYSGFLTSPRVGQISVRGGTENAEPRREPGEQALGPRVNLFDGMGAALTTKENLARLMAFTQRNSLAALSDRGRYGAALAGIRNLDLASGQLKSRVEALSSASRFNPNRAASDFAGVAVEPNEDAEEGTYSFTVLQPARGQRIASAEQASSTAALGLEGSLTIEKVTIEIESDDSLADVVTSMNSAFEDDSGEITAEVDSRNRLILESAPRGPVSIQFQDPDGVGQALGLLQRDESGLLVAANELTAAQSARVEIDGEVRQFDSNRLGELFPGVEVELLPDLFPISEDAFGQSIEMERKVEIRVTRDIADSRQELLRFVEDYNRMVQAFNKELFFPGSLDGDRSLAAARLRLVRSVGDPVGSVENAAGENASVQDIGLDMIRSETARVSELTVRRLALIGNDGMPPTPLATAGGEASVIQSLSRLGIRRQEDGTLEVDLPRLESALSQQPRLVSRILSGEENSVLPRLNRELDALRDPEAGILARRTALFTQLGQLPVRSQPLSEAIQWGSQLEVLQSTQRLQIERIESFLETAVTVAS